MRLNFSLGGAFRIPGAHRAARGVMAAFAVASLGACNLFETDINNPNAVIEDAVADPAAATPLVNGQGASVQRALNQLTGTVGAVTDELAWAGSREFWKLLDDGDISDPVNEYTDGQYPYVSEARWMSDYVIKQLEALDKDGKLRSRVDLARAYTYAGIAYLLIAENYEDFVIGSDRQTESAPIGASVHVVTSDSAIKFLDKAVTLATTLNNAEWRRNALGIRARAKFSKAVMSKFRPARTRPTDPLVNDAGATADAQAALGLMTSGYRFRLTSNAQNNGGYHNTGFEINQRLEIRAGDEYVNTNTAKTTPLPGAAGVKLVDPVSGTMDPQMLRVIDECCRQSSGQFLPTTVTSEVEMQLILAEAALATNNITEFTTRINNVRTANGVPAWSSASTVTARNVLLHARRVNLFLQARRLADHYRFGVNADRWLPVQVAARKTCFFPISYNERLQNPKTPQPAVDRSAECR